MKKNVNPYGAAFVIGSSLSLILSVAARAAPQKTAAILPLGQDDLVQAAIIILPMLALAAVWDYFN